MNSLLGIWLYSSLIYNGTPIQRPDDRLKMYFTFNNNLENEIFYYRVGENGFCRRKAVYQVVENYLVQTVTETDSENADFCAQDVDMQIGHYSKTKFQMRDGHFLLDLPLGDETLTYVWEKQNIKETR